MSAPSSAPRWWRTCSSSSSPTRRRSSRPCWPDERRTRGSGIQAKQRSLHNNYMTLPVVLTMISNHYPMLFGSRINWLAAGRAFRLRHPHPPFLQSAAQGPNQLSARRRCHRGIRVHDADRQRRCAPRRTGTGRRRAVCHGARPDRPSLHHVPQRGRRFMPESPRHPRASISPGTMSSTPTPRAFYFRP